MYQKHRKQFASIVLLAVAAVALSACEVLSPEQQRQQQEGYFAGLRDKCAAFGYAAGTDAFARCVENADQDEQAKSADEAAKRERDQRAFFCAHGSKDQCDHKPKTKICTNDIFGQTPCVTQ